MRKFFVVGALGPGALVWVAGVLVFAGALVLVAGCGDRERVAVESKISCAAMVPVRMAGVGVGVVSDDVAAERGGLKGES